MNKSQETAARSDPQNSTTIMLYGDIGNCGDPDFVTAKDVISQLEKAHGDVVVRISSGGGFVTEGIAIANGLRNYAKGRVTVYVDSLAASIASYIAIAGDELVMYEDSELMVHLPWDIVKGEASDLRATADQLDRFRDTLITGYAKKTGLDRSRLKSMLETTSWIGAWDALEMGFCDRVETDGNFIADTMAAKIQDRASIDRIRLALNKLKNQKEESDMAKAAKKNEETIVETEVIEEEIEAVEAAVEEVLDTVEAGEEVETGDVIAILEAVKQVGETLEYAQELIAQNLNINQARAKIIDRVAVTRGKNMSNTSARAQASQGTSSAEKRFEGMKKALLARAGLVKLEGQNEFKSYRLIDMARASLKDNGVNTRFLDDNEVITRAFNMRNSSASDFPMLVGSCALVSLLKGYEQFPTTHGEWTHKESSPDFRPTTVAGLGNFSELAERAENGEYVRVDIAEFGEPLSLGEFGNDFHLSRRAMINDHAGAFGKIPAQLGAAAKKTVSSKVYAVLASNPTLSDGKAAFHVDRGNIMTGAPSALSATSFAAARKSMRLRVDAKGIDVDTTPKYLIVPPSLEEIARALVEQQYVAGVGNIQQTNPHYNAAEVIVERRLERVSETGWYLIGDATFGGGMAVAYLQGKEEPRLDQDQSWSNDALKYKVALDFAAGIVNPLTMTYSKGKV